MRLVMSGMALALMLNGCGPKPATLALAADAISPDSLTDLAQAILNRRTVTVTGEGMVRVPPDTATVTVGLEQKGKDAGAAQNAVNTAGQAVIAAWRAAGMAEKEIQTVGLDLYPDYARPEATGVETLVGYKAVMRLQVRSTPARAGALVDAALNAGANRLEGVAFSREDNTKTRQEAIAKAIDKAMQEAKAALGPLELTIKEVQKIDVSGGNYPYPVPMAAGMAREFAHAAPTPVQPGELEIRATVTLVATF
jgi:uncharacterized protein YggE